MIIEWHNTRFSHTDWHLIFILQYRFENVVCCGIPAILPQSQWDKISVRIIVRNSAYINIFVWVYTLNRGGGGGCHYDDSTAPQVVVTTTRCHKRPQSRHTRRKTRDESKTWAITTKVTYFRRHMILSSLYMTDLHNLYGVFPWWFINVLPYTWQKYSYWYVALKWKALPSLFLKR